jgi:uncharacterized protein (DUF433 family)
MIDQGVYTLAEVSRYTKVPGATLRSWFLPRSDGKGKGPIFRSEWARVGDDFAISFLNLIEAYAASVFKKNKVKPSDIRRSHEILAKELGTLHPFAHAELSTLLRRIIHEKDFASRDKRFVDVISKQLFFPQFKAALESVDYSPKTKLANIWRIGEGVVINPRVGFGRPVVEKTGVSTSVIAHQYLANARDARLVARLFNITESGVASAFQFERSLGRIAA